MSAFADGTNNKVSLLKGRIEIKIGSVVSEILYFEMYPR